MLLEDLKAAAKLAEPTNKKLVAKLLRLKPKTLDDTVQELHEEAFENIDCLTSNSRFGKRFANMVKKQ